MLLKRLFFSGLFLLFFIQFISAQLFINVVSVPENTPEDATLYIAGSFNSWDPEHPNYTLTNNGDGTYSIALSINPGAIQFKFTRGGWETVEGNESGTQLPNRVFNYTGGSTQLDVTIASWEDLFGGNSNSTATFNVSIVDENFEIPQLNRERKIWIYLPPDYESSNKSYPVLYMHDAQNVFDLYTSFSGEWEVDESLNALFDSGDDGIIVVGIENGGASRIDEYSPWVNPTYGGGEGEEYMEFIVETLKPYIDTNYRTRPEREHTGLMGSSMGGLITMYGAIEHQDVFSKAGVFSPSFWFSSEAYTHVENTGKQADMRIYLLAGENEGPGVVENTLAMYNTLQAAGFSESELFFITHVDGQHSEWYWRREFPDAYIWLYANSVATNTVENNDFNVVSLSPNPTNGIIRLSGEYRKTQPAAAIFTIDGKRVMEEQVLENNTLDVSGLEEGLYILQVLSAGAQIEQFKFVKTQ